jgi:hypothetical protein
MYRVIIGALLAGASCAAVADTRVHTVPQSQSIYFSDDPALSAGKVAIDGDFAIVISNILGGRMATLYRRGVNGQWAARQTLLVEAVASATRNNDVVMANGIAAVRLRDVLRIYERSGDTYVEADTAGVPRAAPGLAISGRRILAARLGCNYDADIYEESPATGAWRVAGRISGPAGECNDHGAALDLDGDVALVQVSPTEIREYRKSGGDLQWPQVGVISQPPPYIEPLGAPTLSGNIAFVSDGRWFERQGGAWMPHGVVEPLDSALGTGPAAADYRGGLLITRSVSSAFRDERHPYLYMRNGAGGFDLVAVLDTFGGADHIDVSGNRAVVSYQDMFSQIYTSFFELPESLVAPAAITNDFETRDISAWRQEAGAQYGLATTSAGTVFRQSSLVGKATAILDDSDWSFAQSIEADIRPTAVDCNDCWVGLAVRYFDVNNQYYVTLRGTNRVWLQRMVAGQFSTLAEVVFPFQLNRSYHVKLIANGPVLGVYIDDDFVMSASDTALTRGRAGLMTYRARADFDNVYAGSTAPFTLARDDFGDFNDANADFVTNGDWTFVEEPGSLDVAFAQTDTTVDARAYVGRATADQVVETTARADAFPSAPLGWFGLLARRSDARHYYYLLMRSSGRLDIRKRVDSTITVLRTVPFPVTPGRDYHLKFVVTGNELHAYVDGRFIAGAIDGEIKAGAYGLATSRAAATFQDFRVQKP